MATLQIRRLPDEVYDALKLRAEVEHRSVAQQAMLELSRIEPAAALRRRKAYLARLEEELINHPPRRLDRSPETIIREDRRR